MACSRGHHSRAHALRHLLQDLERELNRVRDPERPTLAQLFEQSYVPQRLAERSDKTVYQFRLTLRWLREFAGGVDPRPGWLTDDTFAAFIAWLRRHHGPSTANRGRWHLLPLWLFAWERHLVCHLPRELRRHGVHTLALPDGCRLDRLFELDYVPLRLASSPLTTIDRYRSTLAALREFAGVDPHFGLLTDDTAERFLAWLGASGDRNNVTINLHRRNLLTLWRFAWRKRKVTELPRDVAKRPELHRQPTAWSLEEMSRLVAAGRGETERIAGVPMRCWWPAFLLTMYVTGVRVSALLRIRRSDYDERTGWLRVVAEHQKDKAEQRFRLTPDAMSAVVDLLPYSTDLLFPFPFKSRHQLQDRLTLLLKAAGLPAGRRDKFHRIRRTTGTYIADAAGEEAARQHLGHSSLQVTRRYLDDQKIRRTRGEDVLPRLPARED